MESTPLLDLNSIALLRSLQDDGEPQFLNDIYSMFCARSPQCIEQMKQYFESDDLRTVRSIAHGLKGSCMQIGAREMTLLSQRIEKSSDETLREHGVIFIDELRESYKVTAIGLEKALLH